ncbi:hypothetical protein HDV62DRAFT_366726 [Trichoderma sp. SZMC 28011]
MSLLSSLTLGFAICPLLSELVGHGSLSVQTGWFGLALDDRATWLKRLLSVEWPPRFTRDGFTVLSVIAITRMKDCGQRIRLLRQRLASTLSRFSAMMTSLQQPAKFTILETLKSLGTQMLGISSQSLPTLSKKC